MIIGESKMMRFTGRYDENDKPLKWKERFPRETLNPAIIAERELIVSAMCLKFAACR